MAIQNLMAQLSSIDMQSLTVETNVANLGTGPINLEMVEGDGWLTYGTEDIAIYAGQTMALGKSKHPILISPLHTSKSIVFKLG